MPKRDRTGSRQGLARPFGRRGDRSDPGRSVVEENGAYRHSIPGVAHGDTGRDMIRRVEDQVFLQTENSRVTGLSANNIPIYLFYKNFIAIREIEKSTTLS